MGVDPGEIFAKFSNPLKLVGELIKLPVTNTTAFAGSANDKNAAEPAIEAKIIDLMLTVFPLLKTKGFQ